MKKQTQKQVIEFEQVVQRGCRMDVHQETVVATVAGVGIKTETRTFSTFTNSLKELNDWLHSFGMTPVAMESTGVYWKPIFNILEGDFEILLVNGRHVKNIPGHKTDKQDWRWTGETIVQRIVERVVYRAVGNTAITGISLPAEIDGTGECGKESVAKDIGRRK